MKKILGALILIVLFCDSCKEDPQPLTGTIVVTRRPDTAANASVGLYDMAVLGATYESFLPAYTMTSGSFDADKVEFKNVNPGNYIVAIVFSSITSLRFQSIQVKAGETTTTSL